MNRLAVVWSLLFLAAPVFAQEGSAITAPPLPSFGMTVSYVEGAVTVNPAGGGPAATVAERDPLHPGDTVQTAAGGRLEISLANGSVIRLGESSHLLLGTAPAGGHSFSAKLFLGNLWTRVRKLVSAETFHVETENGVAGVRGTEFRVEAGGQGDLVRVYQGAVEVKGAAGWEHLVEPGRELAFHRDRPPAGPRVFDPESERKNQFMKWVRERRDRPAAHPDRAPHREPPERREPAERHEPRRERGR